MVKHFRKLYDFFFNGLLQLKQSHIKGCSLTGTLSLLKSNWSTKLPPDLPKISIYDMFRFVFGGWGKRTKIKYIPIPLYRGPVLRSSYSLK